MRSPMVKRGFTLIELLVVIAIIAILASILFPVFAKAREKARQTTCTSQVRQLATAIQMYVQDNNSRYPGIGAFDTTTAPASATNPMIASGSSWNNAIDNYVGSQKVYFCPSDATNDKSGPVSYGYSGLLIRADGTGLNEAQIKAPTEVGAIADATPSRAFGEGAGFIGGGGLLGMNNPASVQLDPSRHTGVIVGFCDGHAKYFPGKQPSLRDIANPLSRAFYQAVALGLVQNYSGGIEFQSTSTGGAAMTYAPSANVVTIGGDAAGMPLLMACAEIWAAKGGRWFTRGFKGVYKVGATNYDEYKRAIASVNYAWANASGDGAGTFVAKDALVVIVSQNCKIDGVAGAGTAWASLTAATNTAAIAVPFTTGQTTNNITNNATTASPGYEMETGKHWQAYTYLGTSAGTPVEYNGNTQFFNRYVLGGGANVVGAFAVRVMDDYEMVDKVAADPYGIGFCSSAMADTSKVKILDITTSGGVAATFPNQNTKYRWVMPDSSAGTSWPLVRDIRVITGGDGSGAVSKFLTPASWMTFQNGPLFQASYWAS